MQLLFPVVVVYLLGAMFVGVCGVGLSWCNWCKWCFCFGDFGVPSFQHQQQKKYLKYYQHHQYLYKNIEITSITLQKITKHQQK
jgi:hypothetical protein